MNLTFLNLATEVELVGEDPDKTFARVRETLTRMGIAVVTEDDPPVKSLTQSCYILHKRGRYFIMHYKMMRYLNGGRNRVVQADVDLTATVAQFLNNWGMVNVIRWPAVRQPFYGLTVVKFADIKNWELIPKCTLGQ
ncbi:translation repressor protein [Vibrio phage 207E48.1]|nr:translation repressor protein [Vibrio phage 207E48.1]